MIEKRAPTTDVDGFIERIEAELNRMEASEAAAHCRELRALGDINDALIEAELGEPARMLAMAESETTIMRIRVALENGDVNEAIRLCTAV
jgi:hypothetical protein